MHKFEYLSSNLGTPLLLEEMPRSRDDREAGSRDQIRESAPDGGREHRVRVAEADERGLSPRAERLTGLPHLRRARRLRRRRDEGGEGARASLRLQRGEGRVVAGDDGRRDALPVDGGAPDHLPDREIRSAEGVLAPLQEPRR